MFCAVGMLFNDLQHDYVRSLWRPGFKPTTQDLRTRIDEMVVDALSDLRNEGVDPERIAWGYFLDLRYVGQFREVTVPIALDELTDESFGLIEERFHGIHDRLYGYSVRGQRSKW